MGAKAYTFEELKRCTDNFSEANDVGGGGYGKVYRGILPSGQLIAIKRAQQGSLQGGLEFKTEIELLSRVHHKNVVRLLGFCFDRSEQMLVYEYIPNGSLRDSLSGKSGIRLDWARRLRIALGSGKGIAYLHELADPPIIHRDIKSNNILLDENLTAKVADFGLSKLVGDPEKTHVTTQVKGTMGYLDPEYYMTNQLTEKSDVYGYGVVMLELLTGKSPIERGKYVVREVKTKMNKSRSLYDLQELLDTAIIASSSNLKGFEKYVDLALRCVEEEGVSRPSMGEVVKEIENIMQLAGLNPNVDSATSSRTYEGASGNPYGKDSFDYSANFPDSKVEPQ
jgi:serine/threonine protein kinase